MKVTRPITASNLRKTLYVFSTTLAAVACLHAPANASQPLASADSDVSVYTVQMIDEVGASQRIDFSGKLRMLSQRVVASACYAQAGIAADESSALMQATVAEFDLITAALAFGNPDIGIIGAEEDRKTLAGIRKLKELWAPVEAISEMVTNGDASTDDISSMANQSADALGIAVRLVSQIAGQYTNHAELVQADAMVIDVAGRQRMLAQQMSKNVCLVQNGINVEAATAELADASQVYDASLRALYEGMSEVGITPPPTAEIETKISLILDRWNGLKPLVDRVLQGETLDAEQLSAMFSGANALTGEMNIVVGMYSDASKIDS